MIEHKVSLVNGDVIGDLLNLCNEWFSDGMIKTYAGSNRECMFCGATESRDGNTHHSTADCPVINFLDLVEKYPEAFNQKGK